MGLQIIHDNKGKATGVYIPIDEWNRLKKNNKNLGKLEDADLTKEQLLRELTQAVKN